MTQGQMEGFSVDKDFLKVTLKLRLEEGCKRASM